VSFDLRPLAAALTLRPKIISRDAGLPPYAIWPADFGRGIMKTLIVALALTIAACAFQRDPNRVHPNPGQDLGAREGHSGDNSGGHGM
jgi:hypothetical protein